MKFIKVFIIVIFGFVLTGCFNNKAKECALKKHAIEEEAQKLLNQAKLDKNLKAMSKIKKDAYKKLFALEKECAGIQY